MIVPMPEDWRKAATSTYRLEHGPTGKVESFGAYLTISEHLARAIARGVRRGHPHRDPSCGPMHRSVHVGTRKGLELLFVSSMMATQNTYTFNSTPPVAQRHSRQPNLKQTLGVGMIRLLREMRNAFIFACCDRDAQ